MEIAFAYCVKNLTPMSPPDPEKTESNAFHSAAAALSLHDVLT